MTEGTAAKLGICMHVCGGGKVGVRTKRRSGDCNFSFSLEIIKGIPKKIGRAELATLPRYVQRKRKPFCACESKTDRTP